MFIVLYSTRENTLGTKHAKKDKAQPTAILFKLKYTHFQNTNNRQNPPTP